MQTRHRFFDDAAKLAGGAIGTLAGMRREIEALARQQVDRLLDGMDLVTRDEFETVKAMAVAAREENERLAARITALESRKRDGGAASKAGWAGRTMRPRTGAGASRSGTAGGTKRKTRRGR